MKIVLSILFLLIMICCKDKKLEIKPVDKMIPNTEEVLRKYVKRPKNNDEICKNDIERAQKDLEKYKNIYVTTSCFGCKFLPYEDEILEYAKRQKFKIINYDFSCAVIDGQTQGCYKAFIDLEMEKVHGKNFRKRIEQEAEKLMIENIENHDKVLSIYDLEENDKPHFIKEDNLMKQGYLPTIKTGLPLKNAKSNSIFMDVSFIVEKNGKISTFKNENWVNDIKENEKYKSELEKIAKSKILEHYNNWKPGKYKNSVARVKNNFRINFE
ncbi:hypothetical protein [Chryseobacterium sp. C3]|uniref:hypothetical protein n=1 Tax=Chryseobacterium sp. C3 TaxID=2761532 RepID=UPI00162A00D5|nr:hypothetical protein [Chryseobacterium sp. C3]